MSAANLSPKHVHFAYLLLHHFEGAPFWLNKVPLGLRKLLIYIKKNYGDPEIYITENGWSEKGEDVRVGEAALNDAERVGYYTEYINEALKASVLDGVNLKGISLASSF